MNYPDMEINLATDSRTNRDAPPVPCTINGIDDLATLRAIWAEMESVPRLLASRDDGEDVSFGKLDVRTLLRGEQSCGRYAVHSIILPAGAAIPAHGLETGDAFWFVLSGEVEITIGNETRTLASKGFAYAPNLTTQAIANCSNATAEVYVAHAPAGVERAFAEAHALAMQHPESEASDFWALFTPIGFVFSEGKSLPNDGRVNAAFQRVDDDVTRLEDYLALRERWAAQPPVPKIINQPADCVNIPVTDQETRVLLMPEESRAQASVFYGALENGFGAGPHHQPSEEEFFIVLNGPLRLSVGNLTEDAAQLGAFGFAPRYCTHAFLSDVDTEVQLFTMNSPGGHERGFEVVVQELGSDRFLPLIEAHGFTFHGAPGAS